MFHRKPPSRLEVWFSQPAASIHGQRVRRHSSIGSDSSSSGAQRYRGWMALPTGPSVSHSRPRGLATGLVAVGSLNHAGASLWVMPSHPYKESVDSPRRHPHCVLGDRGYDAESIRQGLRARHIVPLLAVRRIGHGSGLGRWRWVVERTFAWLNQFRRLCFWQLGLAHFGGCAFGTKSGLTYTRPSSPLGAL